MKRSHSGSTGRRGEAPSRRRSAAAGSWLGALRADPRLLVLSVWLVLVFLMGGGSRGDIAALAFVRPAALLVLAYGLSGLTREQVRAHRFLFALAAGSVVLVLLHLVPLPPSLWQSLGGREIVGEVDREAALGELWRPLSMVPYATRNALWALMVPLSVLVLGVQLTPTQRTGLLPIILGFGLLSAVAGLLQLLGDPKGPLYFYRITNNGAPVGLFSNRNHHAIFLATLVPMLLVWGSIRNAGRAPRGILENLSNWWLPICAVAFVIPLILITGSRSGLVTLVVALALFPLILLGTANPERGSGAAVATRRNPLLYMIPVAIAGLVAATVLLGRASAIDRLLASGPGEELRLQILPTVLAMISTYAPWGSGQGTFEYVYRIAEPRELLGWTYMNHVHNDWLEVVLTGGVPAAVLLLAAVTIYLFRAVRLARPGRMDAVLTDAGALLMARLGLLAILVFALASISDYPLRVPSLACLAVIATLWASAPLARR